MRSRVPGRASAAQTLPSEHFPPTRRLLEILALSGKTRPSPATADGQMRTAQPTTFSLPGPWTCAWGPARGPAGRGSGGRGTNVEKTRQWLESARAH